MKLNINLSLFKKNKNVLQTETEQPLAASSADPVEQAIRETIEKAFKGDIEACKDVFEGETDPSYKSVLNKYYPDPGKQNNLKAIALKTLADQEQSDFDAVNQLVTILEDKTNILHTPVKVLLKAAHKGGTTAEFTKIYRGKLHEKINGHNTSVVIPMAANNNTEEVNSAAIDATVITQFTAEELEPKEVASDIAVDALKNTTAIDEPKPTFLKEEEATLIDLNQDAIVLGHAEEIVSAVMNEQEKLQPPLITPTFEATESVQEEPEPVVISENAEEEMNRVLPIDNQEEGEQTVTGLKEQNAILIPSPSGSVWGEKAVPAFDASVSFAKKEDVENKDRLFYNTTKSLDLTSTQTVYDIFYAKNADGTSKSLNDMPNLETWKDAMIGYGKFKNRSDFERNITWMRGVVVLDLAEAPDLNHVDAKAELMTAFTQLQQSKFYLLDPETQSILNAYTERHNEPTNLKKARGLLTLASHGHPQASFAMFKNIRDKNPEILSILQKAGFESKDGYKDLAHRFLYSAALEKDIDAMTIVNSSIMRPTTSGQAKMLEMLHNLGLYNQKNVTRYLQKYIAEYNGEAETIPGTLINFSLINKARNILAEQLKILYPNLDAPSPAQRILLKKQEEERQLRTKKIENRMSAIDNLDNLDEKQKNSLLQFSMTEAGSPDAENDPWTEAFTNKGWTAEDVNTLKAKILIQTAANSDNEEATEQDKENAKKANEYCLEAWLNQSHPRYKRLVEMLHTQPGNLTNDMNFTWGDFLLVKNAEQDPRAYDKITHDLEHEKKNGQTGVLQVLRLHDTNLEEDALEIKITFDQMLQKKDWAARRVFDAMAEPAMEGEETATKGDHYFHLLSEKESTAFEALISNDYVSRQITTAVDHMRDRERYPEDVAVLELFSDNYTSMIGTAVVNQAFMDVEKPLHASNPTACMLVADAIDYPEKTPYAQEIDDALNKRGAHDKDKLANMAIYTASLSGEPESSGLMIKSIHSFSNNEHYRDRVELMKETGFLPQNIKLNGNLQQVKSMAMDTFIIKFWHDSIHEFSSPENFSPKPYPPTVEKRLKEMREKAQKTMVQRMRLECA